MLHSFHPLSTASDILCRIGASTLDEKAHSTFDAAAARSFEDLAGMPCLQIVWLER